MKLNLCGYALIALILYICIKIYQESDMFNLKCIISGVDGNKYCVRDRSKLELAADRLATVNKSMYNFYDIEKDLTNSELRIIENELKDFLLY